MTPMLYGLTREEAKRLVEFVGYDVGILSVALWNYGKTDKVDGGVEAAKELIAFAKEEQDV